MKLSSFFPLLDSYYNNSEKKKKMPGSRHGMLDWTIKEKTWIQGTDPWK